MEEKKLFTISEVINDIYSDLNLAVSEPRLRRCADEYLKDVVREKNSQNRLFTIEDISNLKIIFAFMEVGLGSEYISAYLNHTLTPNMIVEVLSRTIVVDNLKRVILEAINKYEEPDAEKTQ